MSEQRRIPERITIPKFTGNVPAWMDEFSRQMSRQWASLAQTVNRPLNYYEQAIEPVIPTNSQAMWKDTGSGTFYLLVNAGGTQKKAVLS